MRGQDERSGSLFSYVDLEARVGKDHPLRTIRGGQRGPGVAFERVFGAPCADGSPLNSAREAAAASDAVAGVLHDPLRAAVDGAARVRSPVSMKSFRPRDGSDNPPPSGGGHSE